jgi:hypothetical protein
LLAGQRMEWSDCGICEVAKFIEASLDTLVQ